MKNRKQLVGKLKELCKRFRYPLIVLAVGLFLVLLPGKRAKQETTVAETSPVLPQEQTETGEAYCQRIQKELESILSDVQGAGRVRVMLTLSEDRRTIYQTDFETNLDQDGEGTKNTSRHNTVILSRGSSYDEPAVVTENYPVFQGALILSQGADDPSVRLNLTNAVSSLLRLSADKITVVKMK